MAHALELLILETVQLGGGLIFLSDKAPPDLAEWTGSLLKNFSGEIPFVCRRVQDLLDRKFTTRVEDLVVFFPEQESLVVTLDAVLLGQRLLVSDDRNLTGEDSWDFVFADVRLPQWHQSLADLRSRWSGVQALEALPGEHSAPCLFLDRDDVVVRNVPYNKAPEAVELMPGICELINLAHSKGYWVALVTNQSGLGRGRISWDEYQAVHQRMMQLLAEGGAWIDDCEWAAYIDVEGAPRGRLLAGLRKPRNGMFLKVNDKLKVDMQHSIMVGDSASDLKAAFRAGLNTLYLLKSEKVESENASLRAYQKQHPDFKFSQVDSLSLVQP